MFWVVSNFRPFLVFVGRRDLVTAIGLAGIRRPHKILPIVKEEDVIRVTQACTGPGVVSARDASITWLALLAGLRACDIIDLRLGDIDWYAGTVSFVQQKTRGPLTLPLPDLVLSRLAEYVLNERPSCDGDHVFLRSLAPHTPLNDHASIHQVITTVFRAAGVSDPRAGTRLLRHTAASRLLAVSTAMPTISAVLGHASIDSTSVYLSVDDERLRSCVLPIPAGARS